MLYYDKVLSDEFHHSIEPLVVLFMCITFCESIGYENTDWKIEYSIGVCLS